MSSAFPSKLSVTKMVTSATLRNGARMPLVGLGTASDPVDPALVQSAVTAAIAAGYRHFDTASLYNSELPLGAALAQAFAAGVVKREDVFVTSKLWCSDNHPDDVIPAIEKSLKTLQLDYLDLYLIHWPLRFKKGVGYPPGSPDDILPVDIKATWQVMEKCVHRGLTKAIGVSNFSSKKIEDMLMYAEIIPAVNQVEMHPLWQQQRLRETCRKAGIHVSAWSPLGAAGASWGSMRVLEHPIIKEIAEKSDKTPPQVALKWALHQGASVLPKSYNEKRMKENLQLFDWDLTDEDLCKIGSIELNEQRRGMEVNFLCNPIIGPKTPEEFWDGEI